MEMAKPIYTWKKNLKPQVVLDKLTKIVQVTEDGKVSFVGWDYHEIIVALENMVETKNASRDLYLPTLISKAVTHSAKEKLDDKTLLENLNKLAKEHLATKIKKYRVLTTVSLPQSYPKRKFNVGNSQIHIVTGFPKKYSEHRNNLLSETDNYLKDNGSDSHYSKVIVYCKSKSPYGAIKQALEDLDLWRGILCLFTNHQMELMGDSYKPINAIRLGKFHTLHEENGIAALNTQYWFEPNFVSANNATLKNPEILQKNTNFFLDTISGHKDKALLTEGVVRYVRSLDEKDQNTAVVKFWATLETLLTERGSNCDGISRRISFLFEEYNYHAQILEHIREYRNSNIHSGLENQNAKNFAFQLQFYFYRLMLFYVKSVGDFPRIEQANKFLDSPRDAERIKEEIAKLEIALKMHGK